MSLTEKYRPRLLSDIVGQEAIIAQLRDYAAEPSSAAFVFAGGTGCGKTSTAEALAAELGCDMDAPCQTGGCTRIDSGDQTADKVREAIRDLAFPPMFGAPFKVLIVDEADKMSPAVECLWLTALESLPRKTLVIFTTNHIEKLSRRFLRRCEKFVFDSNPQSTIAAAQRLIDGIWLKETGRTDGPRVDDLGCVQDGELSLGEAVKALTQPIRDARNGRYTPPQPAKADPVDSVTLDHATGTTGPIRCVPSSVVARWNAQARSETDPLASMVAILTANGFKLIGASGPCECWEDSAGTRVNLWTDVPELATLDATETPVHQCSNSQIGYSNTTPRKRRKHRRPLDTVPERP